MKYLDFNGLQYFYSKLSSTLSDGYLPKDGLKTINGHSLIGTGDIDLVSEVTAAIVDGAPTTLDTLNELAAALGDDPNFATTLTNEIGKRQVTNISCTDLANDDGSSKLIIGQITIYGPDEQISSAPPIQVPYATQEKAGVMSATDKTKLDGINLSNYVTKNDAVTSVWIDQSESNRVDVCASYGDGSDGDGNFINAATTTVAGVMSAKDKDTLDHLQILASERGGILVAGTGDITVTGGSGNSVDIELPYGIYQGDGWDNTIKTVTIPAATTSDAGVMTADDKAKLDNLATGNYLPLSGGTLTGGLNINSYSGLTTTGKITTTSGLNTSSWKAWMMRNGGDDDNFAAIWFVSNDAAYLARVDLDNLDSSDPTILFRPLYIDIYNNIYLSGSNVHIDNTGAMYTQNLVCNNSNSISGYGSLELYSANPFIDFHFNKSQEDYTSRIIETSAGTLTVQKNFQVEGELVTGSNSRGLKSTGWIASTLINDSGDGATGAYRLYCNNDALYMVSLNKEDVDVSSPTSQYTYWFCYDSARNYQMQFANNQIQFNNNGNITASAFYENSDVTLKENINSISESDLNKVEEVEFKEFNFIKDENKTKKYGVVAQEVEEAGLDNLVSSDMEGKKSVDYISLLVLKIQALEKRVAELEAERR